MLKNLSLTLKFLLLPAIALLGLLLFVGYTSLQLANNDVRLVTLETNSFPTLEKADAVIFQYSRLPGLLNSAVAAGELETLDEARKVLTDIADMQQELQTLVTQADRRQELDAWRSAIQRYADNALPASEQLIKGSASFEDLAPNLGRMASDLGEAQKLGNAFRTHAYEDFQETLAQTRTDNATTTRVGFALSAILVLLISIASVLVIRGTMANVRGVITSLQAIARGDGDLTRRVNVDSNDEIGEMIQLFNSFIDKLQGTIRQIIEAASPLAGMSQELYRLTQDSKENSRSQQGHTDSISRDILTMTNSIQEVAHRSQQASEEAGAASQQADQARTEAVDLAAVVHAVEYQDKLVAAQTRDQVAIAGGVTQARCHFLQHGISGGMTERVVDRLEVVQVQQQQGQRRRITAAQQGLLQVPGEFVAVGQPGQWVVQRKVLDARVGIDFVGDIAGGTPKTDGLAIAPDSTGGYPAVAVLAILVAVSAAQVGQLLRVGGSQGVEPR